MPTSARRFDNRAVGFNRPVPPVRVRGDVGIAPYAKGGILPFIRARSFGGLGSPHPARAAPGPPSPWGKASSRRGFGNRAVGFGRPVPPVRSRGDVGIAPYAKGGILPFIRARFFWGAGSPHPARAAPGPPSPWGKASSRRGLFISVRPGPVGGPSSGPGCARSTFPVGEGGLPAGVIGGIV